MNPAVFNPAAASRWRCMIGRRTSAWIEDMYTSPPCCVYLSSSATAFLLKFVLLDRSRPGPRLIMSAPAPSASCAEQYLGVRVCNEFLIFRPDSGRRQQNRYRRLSKIHRTIGSSQQLCGPDSLHEVGEIRRAENHGIEIESAQVLLRRHRECLAHRLEFPPHRIEAIDDRGDRSAAVAEHEPQPRKAAENVGHDERADRDRSLLRDPDHRRHKWWPEYQRGPARLDAVYEDEEPEGLRRLIEGKEARIGNRYAVDMATDVHPPEPKAALDVFELTHGASRVLQRNGTHPRETLGNGVYHVRHELVHEVGDGLRGVGGKPVREEFRQRRNYLDGDALLVETPDALLDIPVEALEDAKLVARDDHLRVGVVDLFHRRPVSLLHARRPIRIAARNDMRVKIDNLHGWEPAVAPQTPSGKLHPWQLVSNHISRTAEARLRHCAPKIIVLRRRRHETRLARANLGKLLHPECVFPD